MTTRRFLKYAIAVWLAFAPAIFAAVDLVGDDTDLYLVDSGDANVRPNILIVLDNTANWNQEFDTEKAQLVSLVNGLDDSYNLGLMMFPETGGGNDSVDGGYVKYHIRQMDTVNKTALSDIANNLNKLQDKGNNATTGLAFYEAYLYFKGLASVASYGKQKTDYAGNAGHNPLAAALPGLHALNANPNSSSLYNSPLNGGSGCPPNVIVYISNGPANENTSARSWLEGKLATLTGVSPPATISLAQYGATGQQENWTDEMAKYMANNDIHSLPGKQTVITYTIEINPGTSGQGPDMTALMKSTASVGMGKYFAVPPNSTNELLLTLQLIFAEVQATNSAFASSTLPVSLNVRGTNVNQVYLGMFRPDSFKAPRWPGNLKLYNLALDTTTSSVFLADATNGPPPATGVAAEDTTTGFVKDNAISFWTSTSAYWSFRDPNDNGAGGASDRPDGNLVEKGGVMQQIRQQYPLAEGSTTKRKVYTCTATGCTASGTSLSATPFDTTNNDITQAALGVATATDRTNLINWTRGEDNKDNENKDCTVSPYYPCTGSNNVPRLTDIRAVVHGDVLHSRPAVVNYNRFGTENDIYAFYGTNAGMLHAVKGGYATDATDPDAIQPGKEAWSFVPKETFGSLKRLRDNTPKISSTNKKPYFVDGSIGVLAVDANQNLKLNDAGDIANIYVSMRRGGRYIYALDVKNPTNPKFLWTISNTTSGFSELGQTWSEPRAVPGLVGVTDPVVIFGAGYDPAVEDIQPCLVLTSTATGVTVKPIGTGKLKLGTDGSCTITNPTGAATVVNRTMGRGVYVVNALTGAKIWSAGPAGSGHTLTVPGMDFAIPADVTIVRNDSGGPVNRAYVGDTGGNVWRIDFGGTDLVSTTVTKLAALGDLSTAAGRRKFLFAPDVIPATGFDAVLIGSGDREHPFDQTMTNRMYMLRDRGTDSGAVTGTGGSDPTIVESALTDLTSNCIQVATDCTGGQTQSGVQTALAGSSGWYITLATGEKSVGGQVTLAGTVFFNTHKPTPGVGGGTCGANLGLARQYQISALDATATMNNDGVPGLTTADRSFVHTGGGYMPTPVYVIAMFGNKAYEVVLSGLHVSYLPVGVTRNARRMKAWYKDID